MQVEIKISGEKTNIELTYGVIEKIEKNLNKSIMEFVNNIDSLRASQVKEILKIILKGKPEDEINNIIIADGLVNCITNIIEPIFRQYLNPGDAEKK